MEERTDLEMINFTFSKLYIKACKEQETKDPRLSSPRMRDVEELKKWYFEEPNDPLPKEDK